MTDDELFWTKITAIGQVAGAVATFIAVAVSLRIANYGRRPRLRLRVTNSVVIGGMADGITFLAFEVANFGDRLAHVQGIGWHTGWAFRGPKFLNRKAAVQLAQGSAMFGLGKEPPYELPPGAKITSLCDWDAMVAFASQRDEPFFTRDWPLFGRRQTRVRAYAYTADGYTFEVKPESTIVEALIIAEKAAKFDTEPVGEGAAR